MPDDATSLLVDDATVVAEVRAAFDAYEAALMRHDVAELDSWFWDDERVVRYGIGENLHGIAAILTWRRTVARAPARDLADTVITTFGRNTAVAQTEFVNHDDGTTGRQTQVWVRLNGTWRIVAAHVSMLPRS